MQCTAASTNLQRQAVGAGERERCEPRAAAAQQRQAPQPLPGSPTHLWSASLARTACSIGARCPRTRSCEALLPVAAPAGPSASSAASVALALLLVPLVLLLAPLLLVLAPLLLGRPGEAPTAAPPPASCPCAWAPSPAHSSSSASTCGGCQAVSNGATDPAARSQQPSRAHTSRGSARAASARHPPRPPSSPAPAARSQLPGPACAPAPAAPAPPAKRRPAAARPPSPRPPRPRPPRSQQSTPARAAGGSGRTRGLRWLRAGPRRAGSGAWWCLPEGAGPGRRGQARASGSAARPGAAPSAAAALPRRRSQRPARTTRPPRPPSSGLRSRCCRWGRWGCWGRWACLRYRPQQRCWQGGRCRQRGCWQPCWRPELWPLAAAGAPPPARHPAAPAAAWALLCGASPGPARGAEGASRAR
jgi:hypothetical protein